MAPLSDSDDDAETIVSISSEDVTEDEEGDELTPALDAAILQTLRKIKSGQGVYGKEQVLAEALKNAEIRAGAFASSRTQADAKQKPFRLADHHRAALLAGSDDEAEDEEPNGQPLTHVEEERRMRQDAIKAFKSVEEPAESDELLAIRPQDEIQEQEEAAEYRRFLLEMGGGEEEVRKILGLDPAALTYGVLDEDEEQVENDGLEKTALSKVERRELKAKRRAAKTKTNEDFLMNYILNRGWIDRSENQVPSYDQIVGNGVQGDLDGIPDNGASQEAGPSSHPWGVLEEDDFDEKADEFELAYNFRYEEPGASTISTHPRDISSAVRRPDDARKAKREARAERKAAETAVKEEETKRVKGKKRREVEKQIEALKKELGDKMNWEVVEKVMEGDWDEEEWERVVGEMLRRAEDEADEGKPSWDDEFSDADEEKEEHLQNGSDSMDIMGGLDADIEEGPIDMDADFLDERPPKKSKKGKGKRREAEPAEDLSIGQRTERVKEAVKDIRALDHEDMIGDLPTRFKYTRSDPVNFGLSPVEILLATDAELNAIAGMKHLAPYRHRGLGKTGRGLNKRVSDLRAELRGRRWGEEPGPPPKGTSSNRLPVQSNRSAPRTSEAGASASAGDKRPGKRLGKKERKKTKLAQDQNGVIEGVAKDEASPGPQRVGVPKAKRFEGISHIATPTGSEKAMKPSRDTSKELGGEGKQKRKKKKQGEKGEQLLQIFE